MYAAFRQEPKHGCDERPAHPVTTAAGGDREVQDLALVSGVKCDDIARDLAGSFRDEKQRIGRDAIAEILRRPRIGEDRLLDRVNGGKVVESSGTNVEGGGRGGSPISLGLQRDARTPAPQARRRVADAPLGGQPA